MISILLSSLRKPILLACISTPLVANAAWTFRYDGTWSEKEKAWFETTAESFDREIETIGFAPSRTVVRLTRLGRGQKSRLFAESAPGEIRFRWSDEATLRSSVFRHELVHARLASLCGAKSLHHPLTSEVASQFLSGDMNRLASGTRKFNFFSAARKHLESTRFAPEPRSDFEEAIARILVQLDREPRERLTKLFKQVETDRCESLSAQEAVLKSLLANGERGRFRHLTSQRVDALWINLESKEVLREEGRPSAALPVGSTLKPLLVDLLPELNETKIQGEGPSWDCGPESSDLTWTWQRALAQSCNGFFLDTKANLESFRAKLSTLALSNVPASISMAEAIGLVPTLKLSLHDLVAIYSELFEKRSSVLPALQKTLVSGTASRLERSRSFIEWQASAKTGTVKALDDSAQISYLVLFVPRGPSWPAPHLMVLRGEGLAREDLLDRAYEIMNAKPSPVAPTVRVSILSLVRDQNLRLTCEAGSRFMRESSGRKRCLIGPIVASILDRSGHALEKRYFGSLTEVSADEAPIESSVTLKERQALARSGSRWVLETSARQYVAQTLISEGAGLQPEALKALGLVLYSNALAWQNEGRPICDTTLCQVFNSTKATASQLRRYLNVAEDVLANASWVHEPVKRSFYLGGREPWKKTYAHELVRASLRLPKLYSIGNRDERIEVNGASWPCEKVRAALRFKSCPAKVSITADSIAFSGTGEGHGDGLDLLEANAMAMRGARAPEILKKFYPN